MNQRSEYVKHNSGEQITLKNVTIGVESSSGKAVHVKLEDGDVYWVPLSQVTKMVRSPNLGRDSITVSRWWAAKAGVR